MAISLYYFSLFFSFLHIWISDGKSSRDRVFFDFVELFSYRFFIYSFFFSRLFFPFHHLLEFTRTSTFHRMPWMIYDGHVLFCLAGWDGPGVNLPLSPISSSFSLRLLIFWSKRQEFNCRLCTKKLAMMTLTLLKMLRLTTFYYYFFFKLTLW